MVKFALTAFVVAALSATAFINPAHAQLNHSWVSGSGDDMNPCTRPLPCATFTRALAETNAGGQINVLDTGSFGRVSINKSVTISNDGASKAGVFINGGVGDGIFIGTPNVVVTLRGLDIVGPTSSDNSGVVFVNGAALHIENCTIRNFTSLLSFGILFYSSSTSQLFVSDTVVANNGTSTTGGGIVVRPTGSANVNASLTRVQLKNNSVGVVADASTTSGFVNLSINDSDAASSTRHGVWAVGGSGGTDIFIDRMMVNSNTQTGLRAENAGARIFYGSSVITNNGLGVNAVSGGQLISNGTNRNRGNFSQGLPTSTQLLD